MTDLSEARLADHAATPAPTTFDPVSLADRYIVLLNKDPSSVQLDGWISDAKTNGGDDPGLTAFAVRLQEHLANMARMAGGLRVAVPMKAFDTATLRLAEILGMSHAFAEKIDDEDMSSVFYLLSRLGREAREALCSANDADDVDESEASDD